MLFAQRRYSPFLPAFLIVILAGVLSVSARAQLGGPLPNLRPTETRAFNTGHSQFHRDWGMKEGAGVVFTDGGCRRCHNAPTDGGGSDIRRLKFFGKKNQDGTFDPLFNEGGPLLQPFSNSAFIPGGICTQPGEVIPTDANAIESRFAPAVFGFGLIDAIPDASIQAQAIDKGDGIHGTVNSVVDNIPYPINRNTVGRFGRKAQMANLIFMTASAFAHDIGITNVLFPDEDLPQGQPIQPECTENTNVPNNPNITSQGPGIMNLALFMRYLAPNPPKDLTPTALQGEGTFLSIGCASCHLPSYQTGSSVKVYLDLNGTSTTSAALSNQPVNLYSDLLLHDMGNALKGAIPEGYIVTGNATSTQWRTSPLWGLSLRTRYLHDAKTNTLDGAIRMHTDGTTGEAVTVIGRYTALSAQDQANLWEFLNSL